MNFKTYGVIAAACGGVVGVPAWADEPGLVGGEYRAARIAGHVYVNAVTGERVVTPASSSREWGQYWSNDDIVGSCSMFFMQDLPTRDTVATGRVKFGSAVAHWGDNGEGCPGASYLTNAFSLAYATDVGDDPAGAGIAGYGLTCVFFSGYDGVVDPGGTMATRIAGYTFENIPGGDATLGTSLFAGWIYDVDLEGGFEFYWDLTADVDHDGAPDFGYLYSFTQNQTQPKGVCGPFLARPSSLGGVGYAPGSPDRIDWFNDLHGEWTDYVGGLWFGGGDCAAMPARPFASLFLYLYGYTPGPCTPIDFNDDGLIDFSDYLEFLNRYDAGQQCVDFNGDGRVDFADYLEFLNLYDACG